ncbi:MAG: CotH kinase family protein [Flavobacteriales bacterium]|nr:CotH kinase family protein [Flavobacteriales bacterium]
MRYGLTLFLVIGCLGRVLGQSYFYHADTIQEIRITFYEQNWDELLDAMYVAGDEERLTCDLEINGVALDSVGIRYKGFSSVSTDRTKNPFNIDLDHVIDDQNYEAYDKVKLSNVIQDPSFLREVLSYEIGRKYMPASKANFARVYINNAYWGLYTNVESVNGEFLVGRFGESAGTFVKCNPEDLDFEGDNSNLSNNYGTDITDYYPFYEMQSDHGWEDLYELIDVLNEDPNDIETVLNVDRALWMHAFNYCLINFDSYVGYAQNYYLYRQNNGQFNPILWDLNMSFASFRLADASEHWDGFTIAEAKAMDPLMHLNSVSVYERPLMRNLFENGTNRRMYLAHMRTIMDENFADQSYVTRAQFLHDLIDASVQEDTNKFYGYDDFQNNLTSTVSDLIDYPGLTDLMNARNAYLSSYTGFTGEPIISNVSSTPQSITLGGSVTIIAEVVDEEEVFLAYRYGANEVFTTVTMADDGSQNDGTAGDGTYGRILSSIGNTIQYYIYAQNDTAGTFSPVRAAYEYYELQSQINPGDLVLNEVMASNEHTAFDQSGENDDWIEIHNTTQFDISTSGLYLTDDMANQDKWAMLNAIVPADGYMVVWADEDSEQGNDHANFKLSSSGEYVGMYYGDGTLIDEVTFDEQETDVSYGRLPNGSGPWVFMEPTFNLNNNFTGVEEATGKLEASLYPNPATDQMNIRFEEPVSGTVTLYSIDGKRIIEQGFSSTATVRMDVSFLNGGMYLVSVLSEKSTTTKRLIIN